RVLPRLPSWLVMTPLLEDLLELGSPTESGHQIRVAVEPVGVGVVTEVSRPEWLFEPAQAERRKLFGDSSITCPFFAIITHTFLRNRRRWPGAADESVNARSI